MPPDPTPLASGAHHREIRRLNLGPSGWPASAIEVGLVVSEPLSSRDEGGEEES